MSIILKGKVWKFGDGITTDEMAPGFALTYPWDERKKNILLSHKQFAGGCQQGDIIVAGENFGCGSSREEAPIDLKHLGVGGIIADSFARLFFRNCIAMGFPVLAYKGVSKIFKDGDTAEVNYDDALIKNLSSGKEVKGLPLPPDLVEIMESGGVLEQLRKEKSSAG